MKSGETIMQNYVFRLWMAAAVVSVCTLGAWGDGKVTPVACNPGLALQNRDLGSDRFDKPKENAGTVNPKAVIAQIAFEGGQLAVAIDSKEPTANAPDVIRLDFSGKGEFKGKPTIDLKAAPQAGPSREFSAKNLQVAIGKRTVPVSISGIYYKSSQWRHLWIRFGTAVQAEVAFGDTVLPVQIVDGNNNLRCEDRGKALRHRKAVHGISGDTILVGKPNTGFPVVASTKGFYGSPVEVNGKWYDVALSKDGTSIQATPIDVATGKLKISHKTWSIQLVGKKYIFILNGSDRPLKIPADQYTVLEFTEGNVTGSDTLSVGRRAARTGRGMILEVKAGEEVEVPIGSPLVFSIACKLRGRKLHMDFQQVDSSGMEVDQVQSLGQGRITPGIEIFDASGKRVYSGKFSYS